MTQECCCLLQEDGVERSFVIKCSYAEIYNETISDLQTGATTLRIQEDQRTGYFVEGLTLVRVHSSAQIGGIPRV